jgi:hypothetical protein
VLRTYAVYFLRNFFSLGFRGKAGGDGKEEEEEEERSVSKGALAMAAMAAEKAPAMAVASQQQQHQQPGVASAAVTGDGASALTREQMLRERYLKGVKKRKCTMCGNTARARSFFLSFFLACFSGSSSKNPKPNPLLSISDFQKQEWGDAISGFQAKHLIESAKERKL